MDIPEAKKIAELIALLINGLVARQMYYLRVPRDEESETKTFLWAAIWSIPINYTLSGVFRQLPIETPTKEFFDFVGMVSLSCLAGYFVGILSATISEWKIYGRRVTEESGNADKLKKNRLKRQWEFAKNLWFIFVGNIDGPTPRSNVQEEFYRKCDNKFILVELDDGRVLIGGLAQYDVNSTKEHADILMSRPYTLDDPLTGEKGKKIAERMLIKGGQIKAIRELPVMPAATTEEQSTEPTAAT